MAEIIFLATLTLYVCAMKEHYEEIKRKNAEAENRRKAA
jgi:hypothetical protein